MHYVTGYYDIRQLKQKLAFWDAMFEAMSAIIVKDKVYIMLLSYPKLKTTTQF